LTLSLVTFTVILFATGTAVGQQRFCIASVIEAQRRTFPPLAQLWTRLATFTVSRDPAARNTAGRCSSCRPRQEESGGIWTEILLHSFNFDHISESGNLTFDAAGNLYRIDHRRHS